MTISVAKPGPGQGPPHQLVGVSLQQLIIIHYPVAMESVGPMAYQRVLKARTPTHRGDEREG